MQNRYELKLSPYLSEAITDQNRIVEAAKNGLDSIEFDGFVGMGLSGSIIAPLLAFILDKRFAIVRKEDRARSHSATPHGIESGLREGDRWLFCDDFISTGQTRKTVIERIREHHVGAVEYVGDYLYAAGGYTTSYLDGEDFRDGRDEFVRNDDGSRGEL